MLTDAVVTTTIAGNISHLVRSPPPGIPVSHTTHRIRTRALVAAVAAMSLVGAACSSDDDPPATVQEELADAYLDELGKISGLEVDEECVNAAAAALSDADAQAILDNLRDATSPLTDEQTASVTTLTDCLAQG
jgi:hypothetical protein